MRKWMCGALALLTTACAGTAAPELDAPIDSGVVQSDPSEKIDIAAQQVLFWDDATRSDRFRRMEVFFPGLEAPSALEVKPLEQGAPLPAETVALLDRYVADKQVAGAMVLQDGRVRYEAYGLGFDERQRWTSFSVAKSFTSTLLGAAVKDGLLSLSDPVSQHIPGLRGSAYDDVTVEQLATMTSGVKWNESYTDPNSDVARMYSIEADPGETQVVTYMKTLPREAPAGEKFVYKTGETNLIGEVVENATGMKLAAYAKRKIVDPAGFEGGLFWMTDLTGGNTGGCCLSLRLADYARFGQFVLDGGEGVVPDGWFAQAGAPQVSFGNAMGGGFGYGYQWWTYPGGNFGAQGIFGQSITLVPEQNLVVAMVSNWPTAVDRGYSAERLVTVAAVAAAAGPGTQPRVPAGTISRSTGGAR